MITWKDEYVLGIKEIDDQHKRLFEIADEAYMLLKNEFYSDKYDRIVVILEELKNYTIFHFNYEEEYMKSRNYNRYLIQKAEHDEFINKLNSVDFKKVDNSQDAALIKILDFIVSWIGGHILGEDKLLVE